MARGLLITARKADTHGRALINPDGLVTSPVYHQVAVATGSTQIHLAGQVAWERSKYDEFVTGVEHASNEFDMPRPPAALIGVGTIFEEGILIEAEVTAVIDRVDPSPAASATT